MRILSFTNCPLDSRLGSGKTVIHYSQGLRDSGHDIKVLEPKDFQLWPKMKPLKILREAMGAWLRIRPIVGVRNIDLIEFYGHEFGLATWSISNRRSRPLVVAHTNGLELLAARNQQKTQDKLIERGIRAHFHSSFHTRLSAVLSHTAFSRADAFVALCELDRQHVLKLGYYTEEMTAVIEPGLDEEYMRMPFITEREERIAFTGSWIPRKGISLITKVMTQMLRQRPALHFDVYGASSDSTQVISAFPNDVHARLHIHSRMSEQEIATGLSRAKVFFFPSQYEGFGLALAEAMACGCACVTTPTGYGADLKNGEEALICDFKDEKAMIEAIRHLLINDVYRERIGRGGWQRTRSLTWQANVEKLDAVYSHWVAQHQVARRLKT